MRNRRIRDIAIDLTSLLDVVMILIFAVLIENSKLVEEQCKKLEVANGQIQEMQDELNKMDELSEELKNALGKLQEGNVDELLKQLQNEENQLNAYKYMDNIAVLINIGLENRYNNTSRCLTFGRNSNNEYELYEIGRKDREKWNYSINKLKIFLNECIEQTIQNDDKTIYIIFSIDTRKVYANDFECVENVLKDIESKDSTGRVKYKITYLDN